MSTRNITVSEPFGLEAWLESTRVVLPLRGVSVNADVTAGVADVKIDQIFQQNNAQPLDCRFLFPLPADAAAYRCEMHVNGRVVLAKVEELKKAREIFKEKKKAGHRAALAEMERDNLFTLQLGNLQPGDTILMRFAYLQPVQRLREQRTLRVPINPGVRYIPGEPLLRPNSGPGTADDTDLVPDASRITPPRIDPEHPDAASFHATVRLRGAGDVFGSASSTSHMVVVRRDGSDLAIDLAPRPNVTDRDFVVAWDEKMPTAPIVRAWLDSERRGALEIRLPEAGAPDSPFGRPSSSCDCPPLPDIYFLLDRSGSMSGDNWDGACKAIGSFVPRVHPDSRVWITLFESGTRDYDARLARAGDLDLGPNGESIHRHGTGGGTELAPALKHIANKVAKHSGGKSAAVVLITDGEVGNEEQCVELAKKIGCPVHVVGVAMTPNDELDAVARETAGTSVFLSPGADIVGAVDRFSSLLRPPVVSGLRLPPGWKTADGRPLRDLNDAADIVVPLSAAPEAGELQLVGRLADGGEWSSTATVEASSDAGRIWARARIRHLDGTRNGADALALAKEFNILSKKAAFIAWDDTEKVTVASNAIVQPAIRPRLYSTPVQCIAPSPCFEANYKLGSAGVQESPTRFRRSRPILPQLGRSVMDSLMSLMHRENGAADENASAQLAELGLSAHRLFEAVEELYAPAGMPKPMLHLFKLLLLLCDHPAAGRPLEVLVASESLLNELDPLFDELARVAHEEEAMRQQSLVPGSVAHDIKHLQLLAKRERLQNIRDEAEKLRAIRSRLSALARGPQV